ncbi:MAG TPA: type III pantothenate kinase [Acidiferrobacteraceae bacterium]|nr:type III pantothenate kinase [Acidiferrobacteraceae bacterium]
MLLIDFGNSRLKWALGHDPDGWVDQGGFDADRLDLGMGEQWRSLSPPKRVVMASVASNASTQRVVQWIGCHWSVVPLMVVAETEALGVRNSYQPSHRLGSDRWAAMLGARALASGAYCVVDCGTAVTVDGVNESGEFMGGIIMPGLAMARRALVSGADGIGGDPTEGCGVRCRDTATAVSSGTLYGIAGGIDRVLSEFESDQGDIDLFITGGDAKTLAPVLVHQTQWVPDLVLRGLVRIAEQLL